MLSLTGGMYLGWALGANDAANVFGTAVASRIISFRNASILCALSVLLGAAFQGEAGIDTLSGLTTQSQVTLVIISVSAALTVTVGDKIGLAAADALKLVIAAPALAGLGIICSIVAIFCVKAKENASFAQLLKSLHMGVWLSSALIVAGTLGFVGGVDEVLAFDTATGEQLWKGNVDGDARGLAVGNGRQPHAPL